MDKRDTNATCRHCGTEIEQDPDGSITGTAGTWMHADEVSEDLPCGQGMQCAEPEEVTARTVPTSTWVGFLRSLVGQKIVVRWITGMGAWDGTLEAVADDYVTLRDAGGKALHTPLASILNVNTEV